MARSALARLALIRSTRERPPSSADDAIERGGRGAGSGLVLAGAVTGRRRYHSTTSTTTRPPIRQECALRHAAAPDRAWNHPILIATTFRGSRGAGPSTTLSARCTDQMVAILVDRERGVAVGIDHHASEVGMVTGSDGGHRRRGCGTAWPPAPERPVQPGQPRCRAHAMPRPRSFETCQQLIDIRLVHRMGRKLRAIQQVGVAGDIGHRSVRPGLGRRPEGAMMWATFSSITFSVVTTLVIRCPVIS